MTITPSIYEYDGPYNIYLPGAPLNLVDRRPIDKSSIRRLPALTKKEIGDISKLAYKFLYENGIPSGVDPEFIEDFYSQCINQDCIDRSLSILLPDPSVITETFILGLQSLLLTKFPLWRIIIVSLDYDNSIVLYPEVIRVGKHDAFLNLAESLKSFVLAEINHNYSINKYKLAKYDFIQRKLNEAKILIFQTGFYVLSTVYTDEPEHQTYELWVAFKSPDKYALDIEFNEAVVNGRWFAVSKTFSLNDYQKTSPINIWVKYWIFPISMNIITLIFSRPDGLPETKRINIDTSKILNVTL